MPIRDLPFHKRSALELHVAQKKAWQPFVGKDDQGAPMKSKRVGVANFVDELLARGVWKHSKRNSTKVTANVRTKQQLECILDTYRNSLHQTVKLLNTNMMEIRQSKVPKATKDQVYGNFILDLAIPQLVHCVEVYDNAIRKLALTVYFSVEGDNKKKSYQAYGARCKSFQQTDWGKAASKSFDVGLKGIVQWVTKNQETYNNAYNYPITTIQTDLVKALINVVFVLDLLDKDKKESTFDFNKHAPTDQHVDSFDEFYEAWLGTLKEWEEKGKKLRTLPPYAFTTMMKARAEPATDETNEANDVINQITDDFRDDTPPVSPKFSQGTGTTNPTNDDGATKPAARDKRKADTDPSMDFQPDDDDELQGDLDLDGSFEAEATIDSVEAEATIDETVEAEATPPVAAAKKAKVARKPVDANGKPIYKTKDGQIKDVDHCLLQAWQEIQPGKKYLQCPFCDHARPIDEAVKGFTSIQCNKAADGRLPVNMQIDQTAVRQSLYHKKMRNHLKKCVFRRLIEPHADRKALHQANPMYFEGYLPPLYRQKKVKYDKALTKKSNGKVNHKFYKKKAEERMRDKILRDHGININ